MSTLATFTQNTFGSPSHSNQKRKRTKSNPNLKRRRLLELINEFDKVTGYKINTWKYLAYLYTNNKRSESEIN